SKREMTILLILPLLLSNFVEKWYLPQGVSGFGNTIVQIADMDRDEHMEFAFTTYGSWPPYIYVYELQLPGTWHVDSIPLVGGDLLWDSGDFDNDGLYDLALQFHVETPSWAEGIMIFESPDSSSYPTQEVWRDTVGPPLVLPISVYDIDQDNLPEIVKNRATPFGDIGIYESVGDNNYELIFVDNPDTLGLEAPAATHAFGDFDGDDCVECVFAGGNEWYWVYESPANNTYEKVDEGQLSMGNIRDCFTVPDADGDGKLEFVVKGYVIPSAEIHAFIFEATGDNTYEIIKTFTLWGGDYYGGYSDVGDVDGDSIPEIALEGRQTVHIIKAAGNDSFYVWETLPGNASGSSVRVYDVDGNGLSEVIISGNNETKIYEYQVGIEEDTGANISLGTLEITPNPFTHQVEIRYSILGTEYQLQNPVVKIYDVSGRVVKSFHHGSSVTWHGDDDSGNQVPLGVYFIRFEHPALQQVSCEKIIKMR
ncbi:MAG: T9SS type A sorting domain-containing protein, partial [candidate division WOR-3 bacterium]|nr:T9SS type A sorting domain-containing protein [candidate division WOR-3 bacterium]